MTPTPVLNLGDKIGNPRGASGALLLWAAFGPTRAPLNLARRAGHPELLLMFSLLSPQEKCLTKLSSGLFAFQTYLEFIQETFDSEKQNVESLCYSTKHLAATIRQMVSRRAGRCHGTGTCSGVQSAIGAAPG